MEFLLVLLLLFISPVYSFNYTLERRGVVSGSSGTATYYGYKDGASMPVAKTPGMCDKPYVAKNYRGELYYTAINKAQYHPSMCGKCILITCVSGGCKKGSKTMSYINDMCPSCSKGDLDISLPNHADLAGSVGSSVRLGQFQVSWKVVKCTGKYGAY